MAAMSQIEELASWLNLKVEEEEVDENYSQGGSNELEQLMFKKQPKVTRISQDTILEGKLANDDRVLILHSLDSCKESKASSDNALGRSFPFKVSLIRVRQ